MPLTKSLDQDAPSMRVMSLLPGGTVPSLSSGNIAFSFTFTRFSARSLPHMHPALRKSLLPNGIANCLLWEESQCQRLSQMQRRLDLRYECLLLHFRPLEGWMQSARREVCDIDGES